MKSEMIEPFIRVDFDECDTSSKEIIQQIKRHIDGVSRVSLDCESVVYIVDEDRYNHKAEAIMAECKLDDATREILEDAGYKYFNIVISRKERDIEKGPTTDRTRYIRGTYELIEAMYHQPYICHLDKDMSTAQKDAFLALSKAIIDQKGTEHDNSKK